MSSMAARRPGPRTRTALRARIHPRPREKDAPPGLGTRRPVRRLDRPWSRWARRPATTATSQKPPSPNTPDLRPPRFLAQFGVWRGFHVPRLSPTEPDLSWQRTSQERSWQRGGNERRVFGADGFLDAAIGRLRPHRGLGSALRLSAASGTAASDDCRARLRTGVVAGRDPRELADVFRRHVRRHVSPTQPTTPPPATSSSACQFDYPIVSVSPRTACSQPDLAASARLAQCAGGARNDEPSPGHGRSGCEGK